MDTYSNDKLYFMPIQLRLYSKGRKLDRFEAVGFLKDMDYRLHKMGGHLCAITPRTARGRIEGSIDVYVKGGFCIRAGLDNFMLDRVLAPGELDMFSNAGADRLSSFDIVYIAIKCLGVKDIKEVTL